MYTKYKIVQFCPYHFVQYHFVRIPFCPYHFVRTILSVPFFPYHFLQCHFVRIPFCPVIEYINEDPRMFRQSWDTVHLYCVPTRVPGCFTYTCSFLMAWAT